MGGRPAGERGWAKNLTGLGNGEKPQFCLYALSLSDFSSPEALITTCMLMIPKIASSAQTCSLDSSLRYPIFLTFPPETQAYHSQNWTLDFLPSTNCVLPTLLSQSIGPPSTRLHKTRNPGGLGSCLSLISHFQFIKTTSWVISLSPPWSKPSASQIIWSRVSFLGTTWISKRKLFAIGKGIMAAGKALHIHHWPKKP